MAVTVGAAALLAGCGAGGGDPQAATPQGVDLSEVGEPTAPADPMALRWQYVAEANAMCEETTRVALSQLQIPEDPVAAVELMDSALLGSRAMVERLRAIPPPPGDEAVVADMVAKQDVLLDRMEELVGQVTIFDPSPVVDARPELAALEVDADAALLDYGLSSCT